MTVAPWQIWAWDPRNRKWMAVDTAADEDEAEEKAGHRNEIAYAEGSVGAAYLALDETPRMEPLSYGIQPVPESAAKPAADTALVGKLTDYDGSTAPEPRHPLGPPPIKRYSRIDSHSLSDAQLARLVDLINLAEQTANLHVNRYFGAKTQDERTAQTIHELDRQALRELHELLVHERQERIADQYNGSTI